MDKELNEAINELRGLKSFYFDCEVCDEDCDKCSRDKAIETVLNYIENSIPKKKVEDLIDSNTLTVYTKDYGNIDVIDIDSLQELLEDKQC